MIEIDKSNFDEEILACKQKVLIFFNTKLNEDCIKMQSVLNDLSMMYSNEIKIVSLDVDKQIRFALNYQIVDIPTYIIMEYGLFQRRMSGLCSMEELIRFLKLS